MAGMMASAYVRINKLFEILPEPESYLKAVQVYFNEFKNNKFDKKYVDTHILCIALVYKDNRQKMLSYKEFVERSQRYEWLIVPKNAFVDKNLLNACGKLMKVYIKAERENYEIETSESNLFYHNCIEKICPDQTKLKELVKKRHDVLNASNKRIDNANEINDDEIDPDIL